MYRIHIWNIFTIKYVFRDEFLLVKAGPFRSQIPYTRIAPIKDIFTLLASKNDLQIFR
ncbi:PH domain-containing protein [Lederbergia citri]|uniref:PH domain-containing protein n=1 Tax=Lederbergia citri TaxID=2833580 RepID=A0A942TKU5_9BACI|nr:PH domain-containing protein [Lederbergia citri]